MPDKTITAQISALAAAANDAVSEALTARSIAAKLVGEDISLTAWGEASQAEKALRAAIARLAVAHTEQPAVAIPQALLEALRFYANGEHMDIELSAWDTVSGEPQNYLCDEAGTASIEDGTIAAMALRGMPLHWDGGEDSTPAPIVGDVYVANVNTDERKALADEAKETRVEYGKATVRAAFLVTQENIDALAAAETKLDAAIDRLAAAPVVQAPAQPSAELPYGSTEFGFTFAGINLTDGDKRLMSMLVMALGSDHPSVDDLTALLFRASATRGHEAERSGSAPASEPPTEAA